MGVFLSSTRGTQETSHVTSSVACKEVGTREDMLKRSIPYLRAPRKSDRSLEHRLDNETEHVLDAHYDKTEKQCTVTPDIRDGIKDAPLSIEVESHPKRTHESKCAHSRSRIRNSKLKHAENVNRCCSHRAALPSQRI